MAQFLPGILAQAAAARLRHRLHRAAGVGLSSPPVLIWLNGPFGVGKTAAAEALVQRCLPRCILFDPEPLGAMLRHIASAMDPVEDFQDLHAWRLLVPETVRVLRAAYASTIVMPMTVWRRAYFDELAAAFRRVDTDVRCFRLMATEDVLRARIMGRPTSDGDHDWCLDHIHTGLALMRDAKFGQAVATNWRSPDQVANAIAIAVGPGPPGDDRPRCS